MRDYTCNKPMDKTSRMTLLVLLLSLCRLLAPACSFALSPFSQRCRHPELIGPTSHRSMLVLYAKQKRPKMTPVDSLIQMVVPGKNPSSMESGIEAALILTDKKRQEEWKKDTRQKFPLVPSFVVDVCINSLSDAFLAVAPAEIKAALRPGGLEKARPGLEATLVSNLEKQQVIRGIPLKADDKRQFLRYLVNMSLGYVLRDAELLLAEPSVKLQALEVEKREIQKYMTFWQLTWYRIRNHPVQMCMMLIGSMYISYSFYQQAKHTAFVSAVAGVLASIFSQFQLLTKSLRKLVGLESTRAVKRKTIRRVVRR